MVNNLAPLYLCSLLPCRVNETNPYNLRNADNIHVPTCRTKLYSESFLPSTIQVWNSLSLDIRNSPSVPSFKRSLLTDDSYEVPSYYTTGSRIAQILHTRLRTNCSALNLTLFQRNLFESPLCQCGEVESAEHYLMTCNRYTNLRAKLLTDVSRVRVASVKLFLFGDSSLTIEQNNLIFTAVQSFILSSNRFKQWCTVVQSHCIILNECESASALAYLFNPRHLPHTCKPCNYLGRPLFPFTTFSPFSHCSTLLIVFYFNDTYHTPFILVLL